MMEINNGSIYIAGAGARTPLGADVPSTAAAVRAGIAGFSEHPDVMDTAGNPVVVARFPYMPDESGILERFLRLGIPAIQEAFYPLSYTPQKIPSISLVVGLPEHRPGFPEGIEGALQEKLNIAMDQTTCMIAGIEFISTGHAAGLMALEAACKKIQDDCIDFCIAGGIDSYLEPATLKWLESCDQLHGAGEFNNAWGFIPGEASGFCLLASKKAIKEYGLVPLGELSAVSTTFEKNLIKTGTVCLGEGLTEAFKQAFQSLLQQELKIDHLICDLNGEPYRADELGYTLARLNKYFIDASDFLTPADCWGDVGAASGPLFVNLAVTAQRKGYAKGPYMLLYAGSEGGHRSVAIIRTFNSGGIKWL